jgi:hypothetical protein
MILVQFTSSPRLSTAKRVYPGIKDLPPHVRTNFRNRFIRYVIRDIFNSEQPWANPDLPTIQHAYDQVYPAYPALIRHNDAVSIQSVNFFLTACNRIAEI